MSSMFAALKSVGLVQEQVQPRVPTLSELISGNLSRLSNKTTSTEDVIKFNSFKPASAKKAVKYRETITVQNKLVDELDTSKSYGLIKIKSSVLFSMEFDFDLYPATVMSGDTTFMPFSEFNELFETAKLTSTHKFALSFFWTSDLLMKKYVEVNITIVDDLGSPT